MAKPTSDTDATIESLLQQRAQYEQWLARLDSAGDKAPPAVRARVRSDYEARLRGVIDQLRGFAATIAEELDRHKGTQTGLDGERRQAEEALSEAEVRHAVGEYSEDEWQRINDQSGELLGRLRGELRGGRRRDRTAGGSAGADRRSAKARRAAPAGASAAAAAGRGGPRARTRARAIRAAASRSRRRRPVPRPSRRRGRPRSRTARHRWTRWRSSSRWRRKRNGSRRSRLRPPGKQSRPVGCEVGGELGHREPDGRTGETGRRGRSQNAQVRGVRYSQSADRVVLRTLWRGARRHLSQLLYTITMK